MLQIQLAAYANPGPTHHVRIDHGGADVGMPQQFLHRADVVPCLQQVRERMTPHPLIQPAGDCSRFTALRRALSCR